MKKGIHHCVIEFAEKEEDNFSLTGNFLECGGGYSCSKGV